MNHMNETLNNLLVAALHDESIKGISYYKTDLTYSDHFPVFMKIAL